MFRLLKKGDLEYYTIEEFEKTGVVKHCFTTRHGGVSENEFKSLNLRMNSDDKKENILTNYKIICDEIGVNFKDLVFSNQVHCDTIERVGKGDLGNGITRAQKFDSADALMTNEPGVPLAIFGADCPSVFLLDRKTRAICLAHSGWRGTAAKISKKCVEKMSHEFGTEPSDVLAAIGPSIGVCCYEVGDEVSDVFREIFGEAVLEKHEKYHVNMQKAIEIQLMECGVLKENIIDSGLCTACRSEEFFSHRKTNGKRGVMAGIMELKNEI